MLSALRPVLRLLAPRVRHWASLVAIAQLVERSVLFLTANQLVHQGYVRALAVTAGLGVVFVGRGALRAVLKRRARQVLTTAAADALLRGEVLLTGTRSAHELETSVFEGLFYGERLISDTVPAFLGDAAASTLLGVLVIAMLPGHLVIAGACALGVAAVAILLTRRITARALERTHAAYMPVVEDLIAVHTARLELAASGRDGDMLADLRAHTTHWTRTAMRADSIASLAGRAPVLAAALAVGAALLFEQASRGPLTPDAIGEAAIFASVVPAFAGVARGILELTRAATKLAPMAALLESARAPVGKGHATPTLPAPIAWCDVSFAYEPSAAPVLSRLSLAWAPSEILVLTGPNGSGKSTCLRLLLGLAKPDTGSITIGGVNLFDLDLSAWRREIAYLPQRPYLSDRATVREAIRLIARDATDARMKDALLEVDLWRALAAACVTAPLDVKVGTLSMGQRQRLALARALAQDAKILLLDEPDANLDAAGIELVAALITRLKADHMIAVAAHTDQLLKVADRIVDFKAPVPSSTPEPPEPARPRRPPS